MGLPCPWAFPVPAFPVLFRHLLNQACFVIHWNLSQRVRVSLLIHHLVRLLVHVVNIQSIQFWKMSVFPGSRQHVKALFQRVRRGGRKTSLACMEHYLPFSLCVYSCTSLFSLVAPFGRQLAIRRPGSEEPGLTRHVNVLALPVSCLVAWGES